MYDCVNVVHKNIKKQKAKLRATLFIKQTRFFLIA